MGAFSQIDIDKDDEISWKEFLAWNKAKNGIGPIENLDELNLEDKYLPLQDNIRWFKIFKQISGDDESINRDEFNVQTEFDHNTGLSIEDYNEINEYTTENREIEESYRHDE